MVGRCFFALVPRIRCVHVRLMGWMLLVAVLPISGCGWNRPAGDFRKDPNYLDGMAWKDQGRYDLARDSFQRAIDVNPSNRFAFLELGLLHLERFNQPVVAIYHLNRYLDLGKRQEGEGFADVFAAQRIQNAKFSLAAEYATEFGRQRADQELEVLRHRNADLEQQVASLSQRLGSLSQQMQQAGGVDPRGTLAVTSGSPPSPQPVPVPAPVGRSSPPVQRTGSPSVPTTGGGAGGGGAAPVRSPAPPPGSRTPLRTHVVRSGENPSAIARQYGIPLQSFMAANPRLEPSRMRVGDVVNIPVQ